MLRRCWTVLSGVLLLTAVSACSDESSTTDIAAPSTTSSATAALEPGADEGATGFQLDDRERICDLTAEVLNRIVNRARAKARADISFGLFTPHDPPLSQCSSEPSYDPEPMKIETFWETPGWYVDGQWTDEPDDGALQIDIEIFDLPLDPDTWQRLDYEDHAMLDEDVHYRGGPSLSWGVEGDWAELERKRGRYDLWVGGYPLVRFSLLVGDPDGRIADADDFDSIALAMANEMLVELGWVEQPTLPTGEPWDMVWFSDSGGWGLAELWAERIEQEMGVEVRVTDHAHGGLRAISVRDMILGPNGSDLRQALTDAEIIVIFGNPEGSGSTSDIGTCVSTSTAPRDPPAASSTEDFAPYRDVLRSIYDAVFELRDGQPTIVRAIDLYSPVLADWRAAGVDAECTAAWETWSQVIRSTAAEYGVPTASMYDALNGPDHQQDPRLAGHITSDGEHTSSEGRAVQVETLHALGYAPVVVN